MHLVFVGKLNAIKCYKNILLSDLKKTKNRIVYVDIYLSVFVGKFNAIKIPVFC